MPRARCHVLITTLLLSVGCAPVQSPPPSCPDVSDTSSTSSTEVPIEALTPPIATTRTMYTLVETSICPTAAEALENTCDTYSFEQREGGTSLPKGAMLEVEGDAPKDGVWPTKMYKKAGVITGFIAAAHVAEQPDMSHGQTFVSRLGKEVTIHEYPNDLDVEAWLKGSDVVYIKNLTVGDHVRGCAVSGGEWVECGMVFSSHPMLVGRWTQPTSSFSDQPWPVMNELIMTWDGLLYTEGDTIEVLARPGKSRHIELLTVVDRFGVWTGAP